MMRFSTQLKAEALGNITATMLLLNLQLIDDYDYVQSLRTNHDDYGWAVSQTKQTWVAIDTLNRLLDNVLGEYIDIDDSQVFNLYPKTKEIIDWLNQQDNQP